MSLIVLDTDVASATLLGRLPDRLRPRLAGHTMAITFVTLGELAKWPLATLNVKDFVDFAEYESLILI